MLKLLIIYDEELYALGLKSLLKNINSTFNISLQSLSNNLDDVLLNDRFDIAFLVKHDNEDITKTFDVLSDYNDNTKLVAIMHKPNSNDLKLFKKYNTYTIIHKDYDASKIESIIKLIINNDKYIPTELLLDDKPQLTTQQMKILNMASKGLSNKQIAYELNLAEPTIKTHFSNIMKKLGCYNRVSAIRKAMDLGLIN